MRPPLFLSTLVAQKTVRRREAVQKSRRWRKEVSDADALSIRSEVASCAVRRGPGAARCEITNPRRASGCFVLTRNTSTVQDRSDPTRHRAFFIFFLAFFIFSLSSRIASHRPSSPIGRPLAHQRLFFTRFRNRESVKRPMAPPSFFHLRLSLNHSHPSFRWRENRICVSCLLLTFHVAPIIQ